MASCGSLVTSHDALHCLWLQWISWSTVKCQDWPWITQWNRNGEKILQASSSGWQGGRQQGLSPLWSGSESPCSIRDEALLQLRSLAVGRADCPIKDNGTRVISLPPRDWRPCWRDRCMWSVTSRRCEGSPQTMNTFRNQRGQRSLGAKGGSF